MLEIELMDREADTLRFYLQKALIDAEGMHAIGAAGQSSVDDLRSVMGKIGGKPV